MSILGELFGVSGLDWHEEALCAQIGGDLWHADRGEVQKVREAKRICARCPVREVCAEWGVQIDDKHAILGGLSERDRRRIKHGQVVVFTPPKEKPSRPPQRCLHCSVFIDGLHSNARYCSDQCRAQEHRERQNETRRQKRRALREAA